MESSRVPSWCRTGPFCNETRGELERRTEIERGEMEENRETGDRVKSNGEERGGKRQRGIIKKGMRTKEEDEEEEEEAAEEG